MKIKDIYKKWAQQTHSPEEAFLDAYPSNIDPGDMRILEKAFKDFSDDYGVPLPDELIAHRLSVWAGQQVPIDSPLVQNNKKYFDLVLDMDYPDDLNQSQLNELKSFKILLSNSVSPELKDDIITTFNYVLSLSEQSSVKEVYLVKPYEDIPGIHVAILEDGSIILIKGKTIKAFDANKNIIEIDEGSILQNIKNAPKSVISNEQLISLIGQNLYYTIIGKDGTGLFDLP
jgi:hypothetical protein